MNIISYEQVGAKILKIQNKGVILDSDVAQLYGVGTRRVNEAVFRNIEKFPDGYILTLIENTQTSHKL